LNIGKEIGDAYGEAFAYLSLGAIYNEQQPEIAYNNFKRIDIAISIVTSELKSLLDDEEKYLMNLRQIQTRHSRSMIGSTVG
jgi:hypothetical protein